MDSLQQTQQRLLQLQRRQKGITNNKDGSTAEGPFPVKDWRPLLSVGHGALTGRTVLVDIFLGSWLVCAENTAKSAEFPALSDFACLATALLLEHCLLPVAVGDLLSLMNVDQLMDRHDDDNLDD